MIFLFFNFFSFFSLLMGTPQVNHKQEPFLIPRKALFDNPEHQSPQISFDGIKIAYLAPNKKNVMNIWVKSIDKKDDKLITHNNKRNIHAYFWQADSENLLYIQDQNGDENWHLYQTNLKTMQTKDLTPFNNVQVRLIKSNLAYPNELIISLNKNDPRYHDAYHLNLTTGNLALIEKNPGNVLSYVADHHLQVKAAKVARKDGSYAIELKDDKTGKWEDFFSWGIDEFRDDLLGFNEDETALWINSSVGSNTGKIIAISLDSKKQKILFENPDYDAANIQVDPLSYKLEAIQYYDQYMQYAFLDKECKKDYEKIKTEFLANTEIEILSRDAKNSKWLYSVSCDDRPDNFFLFDRETKESTHLFSANSALEKFKLEKMQPIEFLARDKMRIHGYLTLPVSGGKKHPLIIYVHEGPFARDTWGFSPSVQWLVNRGYGVLQINYRGSTGYGKQYTKASKKQWANQMHFDLIDGKNWAINQGFAEADKIAIMGGSYGGYAALVGLTFTPLDFTCAVSIVGPSNLVSLLKSIPPYWEPDLALFKEYIGDPEKEEEFLKQRSPLFKVEQIRRPLLLAQGANDPRVKLKESDQMAEAMKKRGMQLEYLLFDDEGHGFSQPENRMKFYASVEHFLAKHLGGRCEPKPIQELMEKNTQKEKATK